ncbi:MAG TPA: efflux RND transporter periplasmic adaptor subunit [Cytophagaceae bacterium]|jgi:cobalt-zinc-cadmium efflux system membrane fusion protein|nr:efflux RND transporter periplasmic adaptor subunit [Cytophagaceae bacterium]
MKKINSSILFVLLCFFTYACGSKTESAKEEAVHEESEVVEFTEAQYKTAGIRFGKIEMKNMSATITVNGMLDVPPQNLVTVSAMMGGFIKSTDLLQGMLVKKGDVLAVIQNPAFIEIQSQYLESKQRLKFLELEYKRQEELSKENVAAAKTFQQISADYNSLLATTGALEEKLKILNINPATLSQSNIRSTANIYAPISGYVTVVNVNIGRYVNPQDVICEIVNTDHLHAELTVFEKDVSKLKKGQKIRFVLVNESNKERTASIYLINHKISEERTVRVHAHLDKEDPTLMPNMYLKALVEVENNNTTVLPEEAVVNAAGKEVIFIKTKGHEKDGYAFQPVEVKKGITQNGYTEIVLPEGFDIANTEVVVKGAYDILSKMNNAEEEHEH